MAKKMLSTKSKKKRFLIPVWNHCVGIEFYEKKNVSADGADIS